MVEDPPVGNAGTQSELADTVVKAIIASGIKSGDFKLKLKMSSSGIHCWSGIGYSEGRISSTQAKQVYSLLPKELNIASGKQRGQNVNCQGSILATLQGGRLMNLRIVNISFSST